MFTLFVFLLLGTYSYSQRAFGYAIPKKITYEILRGSWLAKDSRDLKIFKSDNLVFNSIDANCYLKSVWTFDTDTTGYIDIPSSKTCPEPRKLKFTYQLFESQTGFGPSYKMGVVFDNGFTDNLYVGDWDGKSKIKMGYNQTNIKVNIVYNFKKKE